MLPLIEPNISPTDERTKGPSSVEYRKGEALARYD
jgi:hypothetical protein